MVRRTDHFSTGHFLDKSIKSFSRNRPVSRNSPYTAACGISHINLFIVETYKNNKRSSKG